MIKKILFASLFWVSTYGMSIEKASAYEPLAESLFTNGGWDGEAFETETGWHIAERQPLEHWGHGRWSRRRRPWWFPRRPICSIWNPCRRPLPPPIFRCTPYTPCFPPVVVYPPIFFPFFWIDNRSTPRDSMPQRGYCNYLQARQDYDDSNSRRRGRGYRHRHSPQREGYGRRQRPGRDRWDRRPPDRRSQDDVYGRRVTRQRPTRIDNWYGQPVHRTQDDALLTAVCLQDIRRIRNILRRGANPDQLWEPTGETALIIAARLGSFRMVRLLIESGANMCYIDGRGYTAADWAYEAHREPVGDFLVMEEDAHCQSDDHYFTDDRDDREPWRDDDRDRDPWPPYNERDRYPDHIIEANFERNHETLTRDLPDHRDHAVPVHYLRRGR